MNPKYKEVRAVYDSDTITVYQAYRPAIAQPAIENQQFVPPFKLDRMTWIKPSFLWMMYRCGWASKQGQEHVLSIRIKREGFEWALAHSCLAHFDSKHYTSQETWKAQLQESPVRIQWDPERDTSLNPLDYRSIQVGLSGEASERYVNDWTVEITDISAKVRELKNRLDAGEDITADLPPEEIYPLPAAVAERACASM